MKGETQMSEKKTDSSMEDMDKKYEKLFPPGYVDAWANDDIMELVMKMKEEKRKRSSESKDA